MIVPEGYVEFVTVALQAAPLQYYCTAAPFQPTDQICVFINVKDHLKATGEKKEEEKI